MAAKPLLLPNPSPVETPPRPQRPFSGFPVVHPVQGKEIHPREAEPGEGGPEDFFKFLRVGGGCDLGLKNKGIARKILKDGAELGLGCPVTSGCFDVSNPQL